MRLHPEIERAYGYGPIVSEADIERLWGCVRAWVTRRANELCLGNRPQKFALIRACAESGASFTTEQISKMWETNQEELDVPARCPIVVTSEREYREEIEKARARGDLFQQVRW